MYDSKNKPPTVFETATLGFASGVNIRSPTLYPIELRGHIHTYMHGKMTAVVLNALGPPSRRYQRLVPTKKDMHRELARLQTHDPCRDGTEIGVFSSPHSRRRTSTTPSAPKPCKKRTCPHELEYASQECGDTFITTQEMLEQHIDTLHKEVQAIYLLFHSFSTSALTQTTRR